MLDTTALRDEFAPPRPRGVGKAVALALLVHVGLIGMLALGVNWKSDPQTAVYDAEIWDATPSQEGGPKTATPAAPAPAQQEADTANQDEAIRVAREQQAPEAAQVAAAQRQQQEAERRQLAEQKQQAQERERVAQQRAEQARQAREQEAEIALRKREAEKQKQLQAQQAESRKLETERQAKAKAKQEAERQAREQAARDKAREQAEARAKAQQDAKAKAEAAARSKAEAAAKAQAAKDAAARKESEARRQEQINRLMGLANSDAKGASGGSAGSANAKGTQGSGKEAKSRGGPSAGYAAKVRNKVRPNITYSDDEGDSPRTDVEVRAAPDGTITARRVIRSSGNRSWDQAVLRAIDKTDTLPKDIDGSVPSPIVIEFRLR